MILCELLSDFSSCINHSEPSSILTMRPRLVNEDTQKIFCSQNIHVNIFSISKNGHRKPCLANVTSPLLLAPLIMGRRY